MTLLFSDVRGFTTISEGLEAEELTRFLNSLFTPLSNIILEEQGTIDKFMGDAVMAFWNAPLDDSAHPSHACNAALRMMREMKLLNESWRGEAEAKGKPFEPVRLGIGLNTGICCVGNLGTETRFDYSVIGDNVNVASRLEGQSKTYDVGAVVGESTTARAPDFAFLELDLLKVKGKTAATRVFALLGDSALKHSQNFIALSERHKEFLARFRAQLGQIGGAGFTGFCFGIIIGGVVVDKIGYGKLVIAAFLFHVLSAFITFAATKGQAQSTAYMFLYI